MRKKRPKRRPLVRARHMRERYEVTEVRIIPKPHIEIIAGAAA